MILVKFGKHSLKSKNHRIYLDIFIFFQKSGSFLFLNLTISRFLFQVGNWPSIKFSTIKMHVFKMKKYNSLKKKSSFNLSANCIPILKIIKCFKSIKSGIPASSFL